MFGCLAAGRLVTRVNHLVVFLTGAIPFEEGYGASVHLLWPGADWQLLGMLCNEKPSAIFRLRDLTNLQTPAATSEAVTAMIGLSVEPLSIIQQQLENSLPPTMPSLSSQQFSSMSGQANSSVGALVPASATAGQVPLERVTAIGRRLLNFLHNYVTSYAKPLPKNEPGMVQLPNTTVGMATDANNGAQVSEGMYIHVKVFEDWWRTTERRLRTDPGFLTRDE
ncbi:hypothetical protein BDF19DRAFT_435972 [Syncephalis fuscata]|nr:hypothetical protein BDF19DRAFT_435972 [Syncephalis fuscata]